MIINYYLADKNEPEILNISGSYKFTSWEKNLDGSITHLTGVETEIYLDINNAVINKFYKIKFTLDIPSEAGVYIQCGHNKGITYSESGTYVEYLKMTGIPRLSFFASGILTLSNFEIEEYKVISDPLDFEDKDTFINYSWTLSYSLLSNNWVSWHSYIPDFYITSFTNLYSLKNDELSVEYSIRDENNNYITSDGNEILIYNRYVYG